jgi:hypothetical protein
MILRQYIVVFVVLKTINSASNANKFYPESDVYIARIMQISDLSGTCLAPVGLDNIFG